MTKRMIQLLFVGIILISLFVPAGRVKAWSGCGGYVTVQWGDTLSGLAAYCGTTVSAILAANPGQGWYLYAGQVIYVPSGTAASVAYYPQYNAGNTYRVQAGDTLGIIAARYNITIYDILALNPQIWDPSLIFVGQVIYLPASSYPQPAPPPVVNPLPYPTVNPSTSTTLKVTYKKGLFVRNKPGGDIIGWATYDEYKEWCYYPNTITKDSVGKVWVQVDLTPAQHGYTTGWILVRDQYGAYFTSLQLDW